MSTTLEMLKESSYQYANEKFNELKRTFLEMSVLKSEFDIEKLTIKKQGNFIAHNYHFLIRQYSLALSELRRCTLEKEEKLRNIEKLKDNFEQSGSYEMPDGKYYDIEIKHLENNVDMLELTIANKAYSCEYYEKCRLKLIELNGGKEPTNEQYQKEEPDYIKWFLEKEIYHDFVAKTTGIRNGVTENIELLEEKPLLNQDYQRIIEKRMDISKIESELNRQRQIDNRYTDNIKRIDE